MDLKTVLVDAFYSSMDWKRIPGIGPPSPHGRQTVELVVEGILPEVCRLLNAEGLAFPIDPQAPKLQRGRTADSVENVTLIQREHSVLRVFRRYKQSQPEETTFDLRFYSALDGPEIYSISLTQRSGQVSLRHLAGKQVPS